MPDVEEGQLGYGRQLVHVGVIVRLRMGVRLLYVATGVSMYIQVSQSTSTSGVHAHAGSLARARALVCAIAVLWHPSAVIHSGDCLSHNNRKRGPMH